MPDPPHELWNSALNLTPAPALDFDPAASPADPAQLQNLLFHKMLSSSTEHHCTAQVSNAQAWRLSKPHIHKTPGHSRSSLSSGELHTSKDKMVWGPNRIPLLLWGAAVPTHPAAAAKHPSSCFSRSCKQLKALGRARVLLETFPIRSIDLAGARLGF